MFGRSGFSRAPFAGVEEVRVFFAASATLFATSDYRILVASREFITGADDTPSHTPFSGTLNRSFRFSRSLLSGSRLGGLVQGNGQFTIGNADGRYDNLTRFYGLDGRRIVQRIGMIKNGQAGHYAKFATIFDGTASGVNVQTSALTVNLRDNSYRLEVPFQPRIYAGTGGLDGGEDLAGKTKPRAMGYLSNISVPLVMAGYLLYQAHDGAMQAITAVRDRALPLAFYANYATSGALLAASVPAGYYSTCLAEGIFRLGAEPSGTITADVEGESAGGFVSSAAEIVRRATQTAGFTAAELYEQSFYLTQLTQPAHLGYFAEVGSGDTVADVISRIMTSIGGWALFRRNGKLEIGVVTAPSGAPAWRFDESNILEGSLDRDNLPDDLDPLPWRFRVGWGRNWTVQNDLSGAVPADYRAFAAEKIRYAEASSFAIKTDHPLAKEYEPTESFFRLEDDAQDEADRLLALYRAGPSIYRFDGGMVPFALNLGEVIRLTHPRFGLSQGRPVRILAFEEDASASNVKVVGFG